VTTKENYGQPSRMDQSEASILSDETAWPAPCLTAVTSCTSTMFHVLTSRAADVARDCDFRRTFAPELHMDKFPSRLPKHTRWYSTSLPHLEELIKRFSSSDSVAAWRKRCPHAPFPNTFCSVSTYRVQGAADAAMQGPCPWPPHALELP
jgi:hypothetical protein